MSTGSRLIVVEFDRADNDELVSAYDPMQFDTPEEAVSMGLLFNCKARRRSAMEPRGSNPYRCFRPANCALRMRRSSRDGVRMRVRDGISRDLIGCANDAVVLSNG